MEEHDFLKLVEWVEQELSQYASELLALKSWGINVVEKTHDLKVGTAQQIVSHITKAVKE